MVLQRSYGNLRLVGHSRSTEATTYALPDFRLAFDMGLCPLSLLATQTVALTHTHLDHINGLPVLLAQRDLRNMPRPRVLAPRGDEVLLQQLMEACHALDRAGSPYTADWVPVDPGDRVLLDDTRTLRVLPGSHRIPTVGYQLVEQRRRLKAAWQDQPQDAIRAAAQRGETVDEAFEHPLVTCLGDSDAAGLDANREALNADLVIVECTFLADDEVALAREKSHLHLQDLLARADWFTGPWLVLGHFSLRHRANAIVQYVDGVAERFSPAVDAFVPRTG